VAAAPPSESYARLEYHEECEVSVNEQINIELNTRCRAGLLRARHSLDRARAAPDALPGDLSWLPVLFMTSEAVQHQAAVLRQMGTPRPQRIPR